jgi:type II secretory pathway pseudopilin PulG
LKSSFQLRKAFTIAELLLVVGVMAIVLALAAPSLYDEVVKIMIETRRVSFLASARNLASAVDLHLSTKLLKVMVGTLQMMNWGDYFAGIWTFYHTTDGEVGPLSKYVSLDSITYSDPELENDVVLYATFNPHTNTIRICGNDGDGVPVSKLSDLKWSDIGDAINTDVFDKRDNN